MRVLFIGSHCDDIEMGCGGTLHKHRHDWDITCATFSVANSYGSYSESRRYSEEALKMLGASTTIYKEFRTNDFWMDRQAIWRALADLNSLLRPEMVFTHMADEHQDHTTLFKETIRAFKTTILCYKPSLYYGPTHNWSWVEELSREDVDKKLEATRMYECYKDQIYFKPENIEAQARVFGMNAGVEYAEGFQVYRFIARI